MISTTGEDQTCMTWTAPLHSDAFEMVQEVSRHRLAVTCVDWQVMKPGLGSVLACCSDDKVVRAFKFEPETRVCEVFVEFDFSFLNEFFTLTYMCLEKVVSCK